MDEKDYREAVVVDPGVEPLHPIFTRTVDELVEEQANEQLLPTFWRTHVALYDVTCWRATQPGRLVPVCCLLRNVATASLAYLNSRAEHNFVEELILCEAMIFTCLVMALPMLLVGIAIPYTRSVTMELMLTIYMYCSPFINLWYGGKEAIAAFIRWRRLKAPRSMQETRDHFFAATRTELIGTLRGRLKPVAKGLDASDPRWSLIATAEAYVRACERYFEDWMETEQPRPFSHGCAGKGNVHLHASNSDAREALQRAYLLAHQAVDDAERGPTHMSVDTAVALHGAHDNSPLAFAKTLVPRRYHAK